MFIKLNKFMSEEEIKILGEKIAGGNCTPEEKLLFLRELNNNMTDLFQDLSILNSEKEIGEIREK